MKRIIFLILIFNTSCKSLKDESVNGSRFVYSDNNVYHQLEISNNKFYYEVNAGLNSIKSKGTYIIKNDSLFLNSYEKYKHGGDVKFDTLFISSKQETKISFNVDDSFGIKKIEFKFGSDKKIIENKLISKGTFILDYKIKSIHVNIWTGDIDLSIPIDLYKEDFYNLDITILPESSNYVFFENKKFCINKNKLINDEGLVYKKSNKIFSR